MPQRRFEKVKPCFPNEALKLSQERDKTPTTAPGASKISELNQKLINYTKIAAKLNGLNFAEKLTIEAQKVNPGLQSKEYRSPTP